ncbi:hypothetical protein PHYBLDRAFT_162831 [Phycomyces blakesleeanus NRRL 1555(-)]|uniref:Uncharacterized protein n=1 Tax=Phycomyces blakesleeanus (strain ATCC 8743b / DSM 1359 / FGSC 10004 / NBRC 33097 / NRRL 1555) TaxID=763407 RepID=A0A167QIY9_PHYB8|nr:hypothetical protein PHYBLDRAFT_162831 [Phycomyces blakesleeanus NRRL 1555(-)]OAD79770.1 hypothetical protein PHYBLDRAFT_162831 [Phycomyces blakesleeanus NRRL 1555(-)]|eukprot:XP_018297810.1 hypothetical protein PHYBLDRAFT_162831 [Phycomyces blakesleeanus NRRL 1555(-)]
MSQNSVLKSKISLISVVDSLFCKVFLDKLFKKKAYSISVTVASRCPLAQTVVVDLFYDVLVSGVNELNEFSQEKFPTLSMDYNSPGGEGSKRHTKVLMNKDVYTHIRIHAFRYFGSSDAYITVFGRELALYIVEPLTSAPVTFTTAHFLFEPSENMLKINVEGYFDYEHAIVKLSSI